MLYMIINTDNEIDNIDIYRYRVYIFNLYLLIKLPWYFWLELISHQIQYP